MSYKDEFPSVPVYLMGCTEVQYSAVVLGMNLGITLLHMEQYNPCTDVLLFTPFLS